MQTLSDFSPFPYPSTEALSEVAACLSERPGIVTAEEIHRLQEKLCAALVGETFLLQLGDCAERFSHINEVSILAQLDLFRSLSERLNRNLSMPICLIGRIAGQYAKPRTASLEYRDDRQLTNYYGDLINAVEFSNVARQPDPYRLLQGHTLAQKTKSWIDTWSECNDMEIFTSHEALSLTYEMALTRQAAKSSYNLSCHFPWVGMRTAFSGSAHIDYCAGIANPVAVKVGPNLSHEVLYSLLTQLNPERVAGRVTLIYRFGCHQIQEKLPSLIEFLRDSGYDNVTLFVCDPMHGNNRRDEAGRKFRSFQDIKEEWDCARAIHIAQARPLQGLHLEVSAEDIDECLEDAPLDPKRFHSPVDPRLNAEQALRLLTS